MKTNRTVVGVDTAKWVFPGISHVAPFSQVEGGSKSLKGQVRWVVPPRSCPTTRN